VSRYLSESINGSFDFLRLSPKEFYEKFPPRFFIVKRVIENSFEHINDEDASHFANIVFKKYMGKSLILLSRYIFMRYLRAN